MFIVYNNWALIIRMAITFLVGFPLIWFGSRSLARILREHVSIHISALISNIVLYVGFTMLGISVLHDLGFNLSALLGAAGIIGIAVGFAAQTSISNIISGVFLLLEGSCAIGDQVECNSIVGTIESIDLMSVKVKKIDNTFIRIPNEFFIKKAVLNRTYYGMQTVFFKVSVPVEYDLQKVMSVLLEVIKEETSFLKTPEPKVRLFEVTASYTKSGTKGVGTKNGDEDFFLTNDIMVEIGVKKGTATQAQYTFLAIAQKRLHKENIEAAIVRMP
jgi:small-conductance mechanosensitive channel